MKNTFKKILFTATGITALTISGCKKDDKQEEDMMETNIVSVELNHKVGASAFALGTSYTNLNGDQFNLTKLKYYLSNFRFKKTDGTTVAAEVNRNSGMGYFLVDASVASSLEFSIDNIPSGDYTQIEFMIGVDSAANVNGAQGGDLDPANAMFWDWNTGYIMAKMEGTSPQSTAVGNSLVYHVGGFKLPYNNLRTTTVNLTEPITVRKNIAPEIHLFVDVAEWFKTPNTISIATLNNSMSASSTGVIADNYADMFKCDHVHNDPE